MEPEADLLNLLDPRPGERILEVGCGLGGLSRQLAERGAEVTAIDPDGTVLEQARLAAPRVRFERAGLLEFKTACGFDAIVSRGALHWIQPVTPALARLYSLLRPGGRLAAEWGGCPKAWTREAWLPSPGQLASALESAGFRVRLVACYVDDANRAPLLRALALKPESEIDSIVP